MITQEEIFKHADKIQLIPPDLISRWRYNRRKREIIILAAIRDHIESKTTKRLKIAFFVSKDSSNDSIQAIENHVNEFKSVYDFDCEIIKS